MTPYLSESWLGLLGPERIRVSFEEGTNAAAQSERKPRQELGKTVIFKPATSRGFQNGAVTDSDGMKIDSTCRFEKHLPHRLDGSSIQHWLVGCRSES